MAKPKPPAHDTVGSVSGSAIDDTTKGDLEAAYNDAIKKAGV